MNPGTVGPRRAATGVLVALVACALAAPLGAVTSRTWKQRDRADFEQGEPQGVSLLSEGPIRLGARLESIFEPDQPYIWAVASGPGGIVYAAGGNEGAVYRIEPGKAAAPFIHVEEPEVLALTVDANGAVYAGSSPGGRVYKFNPDGKLVWRTDTLEQYIWALQFDRKGSLYAATGTQGRVLLIGKDGSSRVHFDSAETHVRTLALDRDGNLLAGTDGHGLILRIAADGKGTVLYDAPLSEVVALAPGLDGSLYAAVAGESGRSSRSSSRGAGTGDSSGDGAPSSSSSPSTGSSDSGAQSSGAEQRLSVSMEGKVLSISPDGYAREVWSSGQEAILSLARMDNGSVLLGSSGQGKLYILDSKGTLSEVGRTSASQVTALLSRPGTGKGGSEIVVAGSNLGSVAILKPGYLASGQFESKVFDAQSFATWGRLAWRAETPPGTNVAFQTRSGNTEEPDRTWADWSPEQSQAAGGKVESPAARFLQWRALLSSKDPALTPELREVGVVYMQKNLPPEFRKIEVLPVGVTLQEVPAAASSPGESSSKSGTDADQTARHRPRPTSRRGFDTGARSITWQVSDPNEDDLVYDVQYRALDEKSWKTVRKGIDEDFVTFDGAALPDGTYLVRVIASDSLSNPSGSALTAEKISAPFDVDNTPPRIDRLKAQLDHGTLKVSFEANDGFSVVREASYSVDAGDWLPARPEDGLSDSAAETFQIEIPSPPPGECSIVVRAVDSAGNVGAGRTVVEVPQGQASSR